MAKHLSHLPVVADPSHATGKWEYVAGAAKAAVAASADGLIARSASSAGGSHVGWRSVIETGEICQAGGRDAGYRSSSRSRYCAVTRRLVIRDARAAREAGQQGWPGMGKVVAGGLSRRPHLRYRPAGRGRAAQLVLSRQPGGLTWDGHSLWQSLFDQEMIRRINPQTNDFDETIILEGRGWLSGVAWDGRRLWVVAQQNGLLLSIDLKQTSSESCGRPNCHG